MQAKALLSELTTPVKGLIRLSALAGTIAGVGGILLWVGVASAVNAVVIRGEPVHAGFALAIAGLLLRSSGTWVQAHFGSIASLRARQSLRQRLLNHWATTSPLALKSVSPAARASHLLDHTDALDGYIARFLPQMSITLAAPALIVALVATLNWVAALLLLISAPLIPLFMALVGMGAEAINRQHWLTISRLSDQFLDRIRGLTTLQLFDAVDTAKTGLAQTSDDYRRLTLRTLRIAFLSSAVLEFFASVAIAMLAIYTGFGLLGYLNWGPAANLDLYSGLLILLLAPDFFQPWRTLAQHYHDRAAAIGAADELAREIDNGLENRQTTTGDHAHPIPAHAQAVKSEQSHAMVSMQNIDLAFEGRGPVVRNVSFNIQHPSWTVITGESGSGKTSLLNMLAGFLPPDAGTVELLGQPPGQEPVLWLGQLPWLLSGSWRDNLQWLAPGASDDQMLAALHRVELDTLVRQTHDGLDAPIGEMGYGLSGGQAQRLALARAFLSDAQILLLDEPTAALDPRSARIVLTQIRSLITEQRTVIMASHDPQSLTAADHVIDLSGNNPT
ncbi:thiol reductant ABC exporter subunit CydD [Saccharospirillum impatiens]|uniref:thiol reductant ABC exporter subunit CydD n=1 Tax=Saccharospirillum impatiens TaxID=169438 RepID=UPI00040656B8|nr:thiol reductant ABC exporter subunit CydD [Saccharospirillum impatiens]